MYNLIRKMIVFALTAISLTSFLPAESIDHQANKYRITKNDYTFSTVFELGSDHYSLGSIVKSVFHLTTHYDLYDNRGNFQAQGIYRLLTLGAFYSWGVEIDVYDAIGNKIGYIDGQVVTTEPAKFSIYDGANNRVGIAYLEKNRAAFSIVHPDNTSHILARLSRNFILDTVDYWDVAVYEPDLISPTTVQIFAAFAVDSQNSFKEDK